MGDALTLFAFVWPVLMEVVVVCLISVFVWGLVQPDKRRVLFRVFWVLVGLAVLFDLTYLSFGLMNGLQQLN